MKLDQYEQDMLAGRHGHGKRRCMELLIKFGEAMGADRMVPIRSAHTMPREPLELLQDLTEGVAQLGAFTTTHPTMSAFSLRNWDVLTESDQRYAYAPKRQTFSASSADWRFKASKKSRLTWSRSSQSPTTAFFPLSLL